MLSSCLLIVKPFTQAAENTPLTHFNWQSLRALPQAISGQFVGVSRGALLVIGGTSTPTDRQKKWSDTVYVLESSKQQWTVSSKLLRPLAYGGSITHDDGVICIGGADSAQHSSEVFRLRWVDGRIERTLLPNLPQSCAMGGAARLGEIVYVAGGQSDPNSAEALRNFWALDLTKPEQGWKVLAPWPGVARIFPGVAAQDGAIYVMSGAQLLNGKDGRVVRRYLTDGYRFRPGEEWTRIADVPHPTVGGPTISYGSSHIIAFGGDDGTNTQRVPELKEAHPGFSNDILAYHTFTNTWARIGDMPKSLVATTAVLWENAVAIPGGEDRPGHRSSHVFAGLTSETRTAFGIVNYLVLIAYLVMNLLVGVFFASRQHDTNDYFRGGQRISWWAAGIAIFGTQLSSLTFMAIPAKTYATDWTYILVNAAIILIAPVVVFSYLPFFRRLDITSAYEYLEKRFSLAVRLFGSAAFVLMQTGRMAIVLYLPALALSVVSDLNIYVCILTMGLLSTVYTMLGGAEAVTWTEVLQFFVLVGSAVVTLVIIAGRLDGGVAAFFSTGFANEKFKVAVWTWDYTVASVWVVLGGNLFSQLVPYTTDQAVIQRYLTTPTEKQAARAIWLNAFFTIPASLIFFSIGTALYVFYKYNPQLLNPSLPTDAIFPWFIVSQMPVGLSGLVIAGLFAAGQSGSQSSIATVIVTDFYRRFHPEAEDARCLRLARWLTLLLGGIAVGTATVMATYPIKSMWDVFLTILGLFGGSLAGVFALGIFTCRAHASGTIAGVAGSVAVLALIQSYTDIHFFLYAAIGIITCFVAGYIASLITPAVAQNLEGLTIYTLAAAPTKQAAKATELILSGNATHGSNVTGGTEGIRPSRFSDEFGEQ